jgi:hypothetical protein
VKTMKKLVAPLLTLVSLLTVGITCPTTAVRLKFADEKEPGLWEYLEDSGCDISSPEADKYVDCMFNVYEEYSSDYTLHTDECDDEYAQIPGCGESELAANPSNLTLDNLDTLVPLRYSCPRQADNGSWFFKPEGGGTSYSESWSYEIVITNEDTVKIDSQVSCRHTYDFGSGLCDLRQAVTTTGEGRLNPDGFLEGQTVSTGERNTECADPDGEPMDPQILQLSENRWLLGFLSPDLLSVTICSSIVGLYDLDAEQVHEGGIEALRVQCHPNAAPGLLTCVLIP